MESAAATLDVTVLGPLRVTAQGGADVTPKGAKNQALLALLALSPRMSRPRRWIEDKLWSTFGPEQASANLRQALSKLRVALGPGAEALLSDRTNVSLDPKRVRIDLLEGGYPTDERGDLLEGLDVRDPEFEDWLRAERMELQAKIARARPIEAKGILIACRTNSGDTGLDSMMGDILANQIGENIAEQIRAWRQANDPALQDLGGDPPPATDIAVLCDILPVDGAHTAFVKAVHQPSGRILYSRLQAIARVEDVLSSEQSVARIVFEAADCIIGKLPQVLDNMRPETRATALSRLGLYRMFSFEKDALREAYSLMSQAHDLDENGLYLAWSGVVRMIQLMELLEDNPEALREEAIALNHKAMEQGHDNGLVHALASKVRGTAQRDAAGAYSLAEQAVDRNRSSAFAWKSLAEAQMLCGNLPEALSASARARAIAQTSPFRQWWDMGHCVISIACNRPHEAIEAGEAAARAAPLSRPAHRHLLALYALDGQLDKAHGIAERLTKIEPGFSLDRILNDESYPVRTLRKNGLLEPIRALL